MSANQFKFKQFIIEHDRCAHKVGTDGVLLGAWVDVRPSDLHILDIGTGSGLIALMIAQRTQDRTKIDAIEPGEQDASQAAENILASPWHNRIKVFNQRLQDFKPPVKYDLIVSNPPFFSKGIPAPDLRRSSARHNHSLPFSELVKCATNLLKDRGRIALIIPTSEQNGLTKEARSFGLFPCRKTYVLSRPDKLPERLLIELSREDRGSEENSLILHGEGAGRSRAYQDLTTDFYLN